MRSSIPPTNTTLCGQSHGLYRFGRVDFLGLVNTPDTEHCPACLKAIGIAVAGENPTEPRPPGVETIPGNPGRRDPAN